MALETLKGLKEIDGYRITDVEDFLYPDHVRQDISLLFEKHQFILVDRLQNIIAFRIQDGLVKEVGVNGCQVDTLIAVAAHIIHKLNIQVNCAENYDALHHLYKALECLEERRKNREARGVEGTNKP